jgi:PAS domain S-box-containing protein
MGSGDPLDLQARVEQLARENEVLRAQAARAGETEARFKAAFDTSPDSINLNRLQDGLYVAINLGFTRLTGWTEAEVLGRTSLKLGIWTDVRDRERLVVELQSGAVVENLEADFRCKDGSFKRCLMSAKVIPLHGAPHILSVTRDITAMRRAEAERDALAERLRQAQKLEAIGRLAGGVAHDFNNLLTVIMGCTSALKESLAAGDAPALDDVEQIDEASQRARDLTRQLLAFARRQPVAPVALDLNQVVRGSAKLLRQLVTEVVRLEVTLAPDLGPVRADVSQLEQVLLNLAVNARDAMPEGGTLAIATDNVGGDQVRLRVRDTGVGMTPDVRGRLFEPFFTTKGVGMGTGLGLATVHGIVSQAGGHIEVESAPGAGTTMQLFFPRAPGLAATPQPPPRPTSRGGTERVLLVEDEPEVRAAAARALQSAGYRVLQAASGREALRVLGHEPRPVDLLVTDVVMPGMSGPVLAEQVRASGGAARVLFMSGYAEGLGGAERVLEPGVELLPKPFTPAGLLQRVRALLDAPASG